jgi:hypothetical protein
VLCVVLCCAVPSGCVNFTSWLCCLVHGLTGCLRMAYRRVGLCHRQQDLLRAA